MDDLEVQPLPIEKAKHPSSALRPEIKGKQFFVHGPWSVVRSQETPIIVQWQVTIGFFQLRTTDLRTTDMSRRFVQQLADGDNIEEVYLITDKQLRANRNGNLYLQIELRDRTGSISARLWNAGENLCRMFEVGDFLLIRG